MASKQLFDAVPFFAGLTLEEIGARGVRWPARDAAAALGAEPWEVAPLEVPPLTGAPEHDSLRLGTWRSLWAAPEVELSPVLHFMRPTQIVELSPVDADRLGVRDGERVEVGSNGTRVRGAAKLRASVPSGSVFLLEGTQEEPANLLTQPLVSVRPVGGMAPLPEATPALLTPVGEGYAEAPPSAPLDIPPTGDGAK
jgi:NADH-quinone oxidoreductase subunit G